MHTQEQIATKEACRTKKLIKQNVISFFLSFGWQMEKKQVNYWKRVNYKQRRPRPLNFRIGKYGMRNEKVEGYII